MSIVFSDTTGKNGLIQIVERDCGFNDGDISNSPTLLAQTTGDINLAIDELLGFMFPINGAWQIDDSNQTGYPIIYTNLVSGQRDYVFLLDGQGNIILDIYKVMVSDSTGFYQEIMPIDQRQPDNNNVNNDSFINEQNLTGIPTRYSKLGNGIFLDLIPNYNFANGLKVFIDREATYFSVTDTTKKLGFANLFHKYLAIYAEYEYASRNGLEIAGGILKNGARTGLLGKKYDMQQAIKLYYGMRERDVPKKMRANVERTD